MATVDIEPASLTVTPGEPQALTITITNDGADVEAYHLAAVDEAASFVTVEPDTLLVRAGATATATATVALEPSGTWTVGDLIVRFHIVPAGRPEDFLVVEAIAAVQSFTEVTAELSPPAIEARRSARAEVSIANTGTAFTYAAVTASAGEISISTRQSHVALPPAGAETVELRIHAGSLRWQGAPVQHSFAVTVSPEDGQAISLEGTFTQLPIFASWARVAAIAVGAVAATVLIVWFGAVILSGLGGAQEAASQTPTPTPTETEVILPEPDVRMAVDAPPGEAVRAGDELTLMLAPDVEGAPEDALLAVEVEWPDGLTLADSECEAWVAPDSDRAITGAPRSGDECLVDASRPRAEADLIFRTYPGGVTGAVNAGASRLVTLDDGDVATVDTGPDADFGALTRTDLALEPYPFWLEMVDAAPEWGFDAKVVIHRAMRGDGTDPETTLAIDVGLPEFITGITDTDVCDRREPGSTTCYVNFFGDPSVESNSTRVIDMWFDVAPGGGVGPVTLTGNSLTGVPANEVDQWVKGGRGLLVSDSIFGVDMTLDSDQQPGQRETVTAKIDVSAAELPADVFSEGAFEVTLALDWPEGLVLEGEPDGCDLTDRLCTLPALKPGEEATVEVRFAIDDPFAFGEIRASGAALVYDPTTAEDRRYDRPQPSEDLPAHWIGSDAERFPL